LLQTGKTFLLLNSSASVPLKILGLAVLILLGIQALANLAHQIQAACKSIKRLYLSQMNTSNRCLASATKYFFEVFLVLQVETDMLIVGAGELATRFLST
jgi:hypothetical protein